VFLDLIDGMVGQVFVDLRDHPVRDIAMKYLTKVRKRARGRHNDERFDLVGAHLLFESGRDGARESMLVQIMPGGFSDPVPAGRRGSGFELCVGPHGALLGQ
jgi:hypothetical protein